MLNYAEYYKNISSSYNKIRLDKEPEYSRTISIIEAYLFKGAKLLDIGCGTGAYGAALLKIGYEVVGIDKSTDQLVLAQQIIPAVLGDAVDLPFKNKTFDLCLMIMMLHQIPSEKRTRVFSEAYRVLNIGGNLIIKTQSHVDLELCAASRFFPKMLNNNLLRYPEISWLVDYLSNYGKVEVLSTHTVVEYTVDDFLDITKKRSTTSLAMLNSKEFDNGFNEMEKYYRQFKKVEHNVYHTYVIANKE